MSVHDSDLFLPEPAGRAQKYTVISVDDHVVEPAHVFETYLPARLRQRGPKIVETDEGHEVWEYEGGRFTQAGTNAMVGRKPDSHSKEPVRFEHMRAGCYDADARVHDMDIAGIWAMLNFPSMISGFCGRIFAQATDREVGEACVRAWNDWLFEEWIQPHPERFIPCGITYLADPACAVAEIRRNSERGFVAVSLPERPHAIGLPSLWDHDYWSPIIAACVDTETVICLHVGSSGVYPAPPGAPSELIATLFGQLSLAACAEWVWSGYAVRFPSVQIAMSEGGIGWVAMLLDRLDQLVGRPGTTVGWSERPSDILRRNFWFCTIEDASTIDTRHRIGLDHIMVETDYPHGDSSWPDTQELIHSIWGHLPAHELRMICCENAAALFRHPLPDVVVPFGIEKRAS